MRHKKTSTETKIFTRSTTPPDLAKVLVAQMLTRDLFCGSLPSYCETLPLKFWLLLILAVLFTTIIFLTQHQNSNVSLIAGEGHGYLPTLTLFAYYSRHPKRSPCVIMTIIISHDNGHLPWNKTIIHVATRGPVFVLYLATLILVTTLNLVLLCGVSKIGEQRWGPYASTLFRRSTPYLGNNHESTFRHACIDPSSAILTFWIGYYISGKIYIYYFVQSNNLRIAVIIYCMAFNRCR